MSGNIVHVVGNSAAGGAERYVTELAQAQRDKGWRVSVLCPRPGPLTQACQQSGIPIRYEEFVFPRSGDDYAFAPRALRRVQHTFRDMAPDVVHSHLYPAHIHATPAAAGIGVPVIVHTAHTLITRPGDAILPRRYPVHTIAVSQAVADLLTAGGVPHEHISVVLNGTPLAATPPRPLPPPAGQRGTVLSISRLSPEKGLDVLLHALPRVLRHSAGARLRIAGTGPEEEALRALAAELGVGKSVEFLGLRRDITDLHRHAQVYVSPSRQEACSLAVLEAMACGAAIAATTIGGNPELIEHNRTGLLVPPDSPRDLAEAVNRLLTDRPLRFRLGTAAYERVASGLTTEHMASATLDIYRACLKRNRTMSG